jgi:ureidoglycolate lyase
MRELAVEPLTAAAFAPFGDVIEPASAKATYAINEGTATRYHDLARIDTAAGDGRTVVSIFRAQPRAFPFAVEMLERHPLGSQAFVPMGPAPYLVVVGTGAGDAPRAFLARDGQGVNFHRGTWHHPLLALERESAFLVIDRDGPGENCDEVRLVEPYRILSPA